MLGRSQCAWVREARSEARRASQQPEGLSEDAARLHWRWQEADAGDLWTMGGGPGRLSDGSAGLGDSRRRASTRRRAEDGVGMPSASRASGAEGREDGSMRGRRTALHEPGGLPLGGAAGARLTYSLQPPTTSDTCGSSRAAVHGQPRFPAHGSPMGNRPSRVRDSARRPQSICLGRRQSSPDASDNHFNRC